MPTTNNLSDQFAQLRRQRGVMAGLLLLLVIVVFWVGLGLFSSQKKFAVPKEMRDLAKPLSPVLDEKTLTKLEQKREFGSAELANFSIYKIIMSETSKQLKLVDISYQEIDPQAATKSAVKSEETLLNSNNPDSASASATSSDTATPPPAGAATDSGTLATPTATP